MFVCERESEGEKERDREKRKFASFINVYSHAVEQTIQHTKPSIYI